VRQQNKKIWKTHTALKKYQAPEQDISVAGPTTPKFQNPILILSTFNCQL